MEPADMSLFGLALLDYLAGDTSATVTIRRDDGFGGDLPVAHFFRDPLAESTLDRAALDFCRGSVLDAGAGSGLHSLVLQDRGVDVTAIDVCAGAVEVMRRRGVRGARQADVSDFAGGPFGTVLMLGNGIGLGGTLAGLDRLLAHLRGQLAEDGQLLCESVDIRRTDEEVHLRYHEANRRAGRYIGEARTRVEYKGRTGPWWSWLHVDPDTLQERAEHAGYVCTVVARLPAGPYLARLARTP